MSENKPVYISDNSDKWAIIAVLILSTLFAGEPDIADALMNLINTYANSLK